MLHNSSEKEVYPGGEALKFLLVKLECLMFQEVHRNAQCNEFKMKKVSNVNKLWRFDHIFLVITNRDFYCMLIGGIYKIMTKLM